MTLAQAKAAGALPDVLFTGAVTHEELLAWYSGALCLAVPSHHEGFGLPPLEAMATGCPAVVSAGGALPEVVGKAGLVYGRPDDEAALADALRRMVSLPDERARLARAGLERAREMTWELTAALTRVVWRQALARGSARAGHGLRRSQQTAVPASAGTSDQIR
jgi:glycosyltransferase involved in cell wall biosynthesis